MSAIASVNFVEILSVLGAFYGVLILAFLPAYIAGRVRERAATVDAELHVQDAPLGDVVLGHARFQNAFYFGEPEEQVEVAA